MTASAVAVVGTGLIGTSVALALRTAGVRVLLADRDPARLGLACELDAGRPWDQIEPVDHVVLAVPPSVLAAALRSLQMRELGRTFSDVASVKVAPVVEAEALGCNMATFCGGHPIAGRERNGPSAARPDLFQGQLWVLTPGPHTDATAREAAEWVARTCGARPVEMTPAQHDRALGLTSHVPQLVASLLAARLREAQEITVELAGQGLQDTTRLAASDPKLWADVVASNAEPVRGVLAELAGDLDQLLHALASEDAADRRHAVADLVARGNAGRRRLPGKHGVAATFVPVPVVVEDAPGRLAQLFADTAAAGVNVEDLVLEHAPGRPLAVAEIAVRPADANRLAAALTRAGWSVHLGGALPPPHGHTA